MQCLVLASTLLSRLFRNLSLSFSEVSGFLLDQVDLLEVEKRPESLGRGRTTAALPVFLR